MDTYRLAQKLAARLAVAHPDLLPLLTPILKRLAPCRHSIDFASVSWHGTLYSLTGTQAAVVKVLWKAWKNGTPAVRQETLLMQAASDCGRLSDTFRNNPAWGTLVVPGGSKGTYQLNDNPNATERTGHEPDHTPDGP